MEKMSDRELKQLRDLQAKAKRVQRADTEFFRNIDERREEVIEHLNIADRLEDAAKLYGTDADSLYKWLTNDKQITTFQNEQNIQSDSEIEVINEQRIEEDSISNDDGFESDRTYRPY